MQLSEWETSLTEDYALYTIAVFAACVLDTVIHRVTFFRPKQLLRVIISEEVYFQIFHLNVALKRHTLRSLYFYLYLLLRICKYCM